MTAPDTPSCSDAAMADLARRIGVIHSALRQVDESVRCYTLTLQSSDAPPESRLREWRAMWRTTRLAYLAAAAECAAMPERDPVPSCGTSEPPGAEPVRARIQTIALGVVRAFDHDGVWVGCLDDRLEACATVEGWTAYAQVYFSEVRDLDDGRVAAHVRWAIERAVSAAEAQDS